MDLLQQIFSTGLDLLFPEFCLICGTKGCCICAACRSNRLRLYPTKVCHVCGLAIGEPRQLVHSRCRSRTRLSGVFSVLAYTKEAGQILHQLKYGLYFSIAKDIGKMLRRKFSECQAVYRPGINLVVPVPLHRRRLWWRGFNQAELLAKEISPEYRNILQRIRQKPPQVGSDREARKNNVRGIFRVRSSVQKSGGVKNKRILLVDDVMTTGATLEECAGMLRHAGAEAVYALVWARD